MKHDEGLSLADYASIVWRRKWLFLFVSLIVLTLGIFTIFKMPLVYRSTGIIQIEQQEIPSQWVDSTVSSVASERIQAITQLVMTSANLSNIVEKFNLFQERGDSLDEDEKNALVKNNFSMEPIQSRDRRSIVAFSISYDDRLPETALNVANELITRYLNINLESRKQSVTDTRRFLEEEANRIEKQLAEIEKEISNFKEIHQSALPEFQDINLQAYERVEQQITEIDRELRSLAERRTVLEAGIDSASRLLRVDTMNSESTQDVDPSVQRLSELRPQYVRAQTRYSEAHPDVIKLKREIASLEAEIAKNEENVDPATSSVPEDPSSIRLNTELSTAIIEQRSLRNRRNELLVKLDDLEERINKTPEVEREYRSLIRDHDNLQDKYNDIRDKQNSARVSESLEQEQKAERFTVIEPPRLPHYPHSPSHKKLLVMSAGIAFLSGLGAVLGINLFDGRIRNINTISSLTNVPVLTTVGYIKSEKDRRRRVRKIVMLMLFLATIVTLGIYFINRYHLTLETLQLEQLLQDIRARVSKLGILR